MVVQPFFVAFSVSVVVPAAPALNVIELVFVGPVIVPLEIVQLNVASRSAGTLAVRPVSPGWADPGAEIATFAPAINVTVCVSVAEQAPFETVTEYVADGADCETVIVCVVAPLDQR
jgi:hypothetical protein